MAVSQRLRYEILRRDNHACRYCGATAPDVKLNVDHVIPQALGGSNDPTNLVTACATCNGGKTSSMPNAMPVADVDQATFRRAAAVGREEVAKLTEHLWRGGYPPSWSVSDVEAHAAESAWRFAWSVAGNGGEPTTAQYDEFHVHRGALVETGHSVGEILCAAVEAGMHLTGYLSWGLKARDAQYAPISGELFSRIDGAFDTWLGAWREAGGSDPTPNQVGMFKGLLICAARAGYSREEISAGAQMAGGRHSCHIDDFAPAAANAGGAN